MLRSSSAGPGPGPGPGPGAGPDAALGPPDPFGCACAVLAPGSCAPHARCSGYSAGALKPHVQLYAVKGFCQLNPGAP